MEIKILLPLMVGTMYFFHTLNHTVSKTQCKLGISKWKFRITDTFFGKTSTGKNWIRENEHLKKKNFDSWKLIPSEYNFMTHENKYLRKTVLLKQLDIFLSLKTLLQRDNILSMFLSVWMGKRRWNQNTASNYATNWNQICSWWGLKNQ